MSKLAEYIPHLRKSDRPIIDEDVSDTQVMLGCQREFILTCKVALRQKDRPLKEEVRVDGQVISTLHELWEHTMERTYDEIRSLEKDLKELFEIQQIWDRRFLE